MTQPVLRRPAVIEPVGSLAPLSLASLGLATCLIAISTMMSACAHSRPSHEFQPNSHRVNDLPTATQPRMGIRSFSELDPIAAAAELSGRVYAASGVKLWRFEPVATEVPCPPSAAGKPIVAMTAHPQHGLWVATRDGLVARLRDGTWQVIAAPPIAAVSVLASSADGIWIGGEGLARWDGRSWHRIGINDRVTAIQPAVDARIWIGTQTAGMFVTGLADPHPVAASPSTDDALKQVKGIASSPSGALIVVGRDSRNLSLLRMFDGRYWTSYRPPGPLPFDWIGRAANTLLLGSGEQVFTIESLHGAARQVPPKDWMVLEATSSGVAPAGYPHETFALRSESVHISSPTVVSDDGRDLLVGTRVLGLARISPRQVDWLRPVTLVSGERRLKMGCAGGACYLAIAGRSVRFNGTSFEQHRPLGLPASDYVHAFVPLNESTIWIVHGAGRPSRVRGLDVTNLVISELEGGQAKPLHELTLQAAKGFVQVVFAKYSPRGELWMGLQIVQDDGKVQPWGVVVIERGRLVAHHRTTPLPGETHHSARTPIPDDVRDVAFGGDGVTWLATSSGIGRLSRDTFVLYTENDGLEGEIAYAVGWSARGEVLAGTLEGVGRFDGAAWQFDWGPPYTNATRALLSEGPTVWAGTAAGLVVRNSTGVDVISRADGLLTDSVLDLHRATDDTLWVLTEEGVSVMEDDSR